VDHDSRLSSLPYWFGGNGGESDPINTLSFGAFLVISVVVLSKRGLDWGGLVRRNMSLFLIYGYLVCSAVWSEMAFVSLKRLIKDFETVLVGLIFLSEVDPVTGSGRFT